MAQPLRIVPDDLFQVSGSWSLMARALSTSSWLSATKKLGIRVVDDVLHLVHHAVLKEPDRRFHPRTGRPSPPTEPSGRLSPIMATLSSRFRPETHHAQTVILLTLSR